MVEALNGKWQLESTDDIEPFLKALELSEEVREKAAKMFAMQPEGSGQILKIEGDTITRSYFIGETTQKETTLTLGAETERESLAGPTLTLAEIKDNKVLYTEKVGGKNMMTSELEVVDDKLIVTNTAGDVSVKRVHNRV